MDKIDVDTDTQNLWRVQLRSDAYFGFAPTHDLGDVLSCVTASSSCLSMSMFSSAPCLTRLAGVTSRNYTEIWPYGQHKGKAP